MKKTVFLFAFLFIALVLPVTAATEMVNNSEFDDFSGVPWYSWTGGIYFYDYDGDSICSYGWWDEASIYQNTGSVILPNATYVMQVRVRAAEGGTNEWGEGVDIQIQGI